MSAMRRHAAYTRPLATIKKKKMYNPRKDFEEYFNSTIGLILESKGFKRYKKRNYLRC